MRGPSRRLVARAYGVKLTHPSIDRYPDCTMMRSLLLARVALLVAFAWLLGVVGPFDGTAAAQTLAAGTLKPRPKTKGRTYKIHIDSSPQQAAVYWDAGSTPAPRDFGIAGYTPLDLRLPKGPVKVIIELRGFKSVERDLDVRKTASVRVTMERANMPGKPDLRAGGDGSAAGAEVAITVWCAARSPTPSSSSPAIIRWRFAKPGTRHFRNGWTLARTSTARATSAWSAPSSRWVRCS